MSKDGVNSRVACNECSKEMKIERGCDGGVIWKIGPYNHDGCPDKLVKEQLPFITMW